MDNVRLPLLTLGIATGLSPLYAQPQPAAPLAFEVASIKPYPVAPGTVMIIIPKGPDRPTLAPRGDRFQVFRSTLNEIIMLAYDVKEHQIVGSPDWAIPPRGDRYDIIAKTDASATDPQLREMLRTLLAERFRLKLRREMRELPTYALVVSKPGKLRELSPAELDAGEAAFRAARARGVTPLAAVPSRPELSRSTMFHLARLVSNVVDFPVFDHTGLAGTYEFPAPDWRQLGMDKRAGAGDEASGGPSIFTQLQDLGLKLDKRKDRVEVLVVERAEKPTAN